ncbi:hypothetical protein C8J57DRAFT_1321004, partial [Mycena rebaudengoi]
VETCPSPPLDLRSRPPRIDISSWMLASRTWIETTDDKIPPPDVACSPWIVLNDAWDPDCSHFRMLTYFRAMPWTGMDTGRDEDRGMDAGRDEDHDGGRDWIDSGLLAAYVDGNVVYHRPNSYPGCVAENTPPRAAGSPATTDFFSAHGPSTELGNLGTVPVFSRPIVPRGLFV